MSDYLTGFGSFLEQQASAELQHRREMEQAKQQAKTAEQVGAGSMAYIEGQLAKLKEQPAWVMPAIIGGAVLLVYLVVRK